MILSYAISRWRFTRAFEPDGDDFVYRAKATAPAIRIRRAERDELLLTFRRKFWLYRLSTLGVMLALIFVLAGLAMLVPIEAVETVTLVGVLAITVPLLVAVFVLDRRLMQLPARQFADRAWVSPGRTWREAYDERAQRRSWVSYASWVLIVIALAWVTFPGSRAVWWTVPAWIAYFGLAFIIWSYNVWRKHRFSRLPQD